MASVSRKCRYCNPLAPANDHSLTFGFIFVHWSFAQCLPGTLANRCISHGGQMMLDFLVIFDSVRRRFKAAFRARALVFGEHYLDIFDAAAFT